MPGNYLSDAPSDSISSLDTNNENLIGSTRPNLEDEHLYTRLQLRATAQKKSQWSNPVAADPIRSSVVRNSFKDFTRDYSAEKDDDMHDSDSSAELEMGRGLGKSTRATPSKLNQSYLASDVILDVSNLSPVDTKAKSRSKSTRRVLGVEQDLRKNTQLRRVSSQKNGRVPSSTRPASASAQNTYTEESFGLPDLTGLSNIIDTAMDSRRPQQSRYRSRYSEGARPISNGLDKFRPVESVPISDENKWQMLALQSLHERIKSLEHDNAQLSHNCHEYKTHVEELEEELNVERTIRQADSANGSDDGMPNKRGEVLKLQVANARLDATNQRLSRRVQELEEKMDNSDNLTKRMLMERNKMARDLSATKDQQSVKLRQENSILKKENKTLRERVDELQALNDELKAQLDMSQQRHDDETQNWTRRERQLEEKAVEGDTAIVAENQTLHLELSNLKSKYDEDIQRLRREAENRRATARAAQLEHARLQMQNQQLKQELEDFKEEQERELRRGKAKMTGGASQQRINEELRQSNEQLKTELAQLKAATGGLRTTENSKRSRSTTRRKTDVRTASPVQYSDSDGVSEQDSTTNLARTILTHTASRPIPIASADRHKSVPKVEADTYISVMSPEEIMSIRKSVEEEYASKRARGRSSSRSNLARKSSLKNISQPKTPRTALNDDLTHETNHWRHETVTGAAGQQDTQQSRHSSAASRRRTVSKNDDAGMTSAFILPDITLNIAGLRPTLSKSARNVLNTLAPHSPRQCTVCHRIVSAQNPTSAPESPKISTPVPVSTLPISQGEIDTTVRPSEAPLKALSRVIRQLADEIVHLKLELHAFERRLTAHDPSRSKRERDLLHEAIDGLNKSIQVKCDQIYSLYDVLEGHKIDATNTMAAEQIDHTENLEEEDMTEDVREILEELKAGRRVTIQSPPVSRPVEINARVEDVESEADSERPWEGFSETASLASRRFG